MGTTEGYMYGADDHTLTIGGKLVNDIWTRTKFWIMSWLKYHSPNDFFLNFIYFHVCMMFGIRYWQFSWCWKHSLVWTYFQDHYVEASIDKWCDFCVVLNILQKITTRSISWQWLEFVLAVREMSGKSQGFFFCQPWGNLVNDAI